jgi:hypothetical protein
MVRLVSLLLGLFLILCPLGAQEIFGDIDDIVAELAEITGLAVKRAVPHETIDRDRLRRYLEQRFAEAVKPEELREEELVLKKFGLIPQDFDLKANTLDLLTEQAAAFYDYRKKRLYLVNSPSVSIQQTVLVHELAHALADQHFDLAKFLEAGDSSDDAQMARMAVMEGQASWLMTEYTARQAGRSIKDMGSMLRAMSGSIDVSGGEYPVLEATPLYLRETLLFPYTKGLLFQQDVVVKSGKEAFRQVFRAPPASTQQILHSDKYFAGVKPLRPPVPALATAREYRKLSEGSVSELDHDILLRQYAAKSAGDAAQAWAGGSYQLWEHKKDNRLVLAYVSEWESEEAASRFFDLYRLVLAGKWRKYELTSEAPGAVTGNGDDGLFLLRREGRRVSSLEGLHTASEAR